MADQTNVASPRFAAQFLADHRIKIYKGTERILSPPGKLYDIKLPNTRYFVGDKFVERGETERVNSYEIVRGWGFVVASRRPQPEERWNFRGQVVHELRPFGAEGTLDNMPPKAYVEHDPYTKQIRLISQNAGPLGFGPWIKIDGGKEEKFQPKRPMTISSYSENPDGMIDDQIRAWLGMEAEKEPIKIKEAAFMITDSNEIVCFPNTPDMPSILISGLKGSGKSYTLHSLVSRFFWKPYYDYKIAILNDSSRETGTWCKPNTDTEQVAILRKLNERPLPLPCVYLHPEVKEDYEKLHIGSVGHMLTIPFKEIVDNHKEYLKLEGSVRYFSKIREKLRNCKNQEEAESLLETLQMGLGIPPQTANKIRAEFDTLFDSGMTDIASNEGVKPWRTSKNMKKEYNPMAACVLAGVVPILETEYVSNMREMISIYFTYFVKDLFIRQKQDPDFAMGGGKLLLVVDEAHVIAQKGQRSGADLLLRRCVREGRPRRIGTLLATQKFGELPDVIKDNSTYLLCFKNPGEANLIANQYKMGKEKAQMITDLAKHQCLAYTTEHFIVYDMYGRRRESKPNEVFRGKTLPPFSMHKRPTMKDR